jgi:hypothetical protein
MRWDLPLGRPSDPSIATKDSLSQFGALYVPEQMKASVMFSLPQKIDRSQREAI